jgi:hypothetical protein
MPPVRDQRQRGTCVAFAVTAAHEIARASGAPVTEDLSEEALFWGCKLIDGNWNSGTRFSSAAAAIAATGQPIEAVWPYVPQRTPGIPYNPPSAPTGTWYKTTLTKISTDLQSLRAIIDSGSPVILALTVFDTLYRPSTDGRIHAPASQSKPCGRHAVLAITHDPTAFLIRNSWGITWALAGYGWLSDEYAENHVREAWALQSSRGGPPLSSFNSNAGEIYESS